MHNATFFPKDAGFEMLKVMMVRVLFAGGTYRERTLRRPGPSPAAPDRAPLGHAPPTPARPSCPTAPAQVSVDVAFYRIDSVERHNH